MHVNTIKENVIGLRKTFLKMTLFKVGIYQVVLRLGTIRALKRGMTKYVK